MRMTINVYLHKQTQDKSFAIACAFSELFPWCGFLNIYKSRATIALP